ncbi:MAG: 50S ribosomal protein L35 [Acidimicrobiales bacterium]
MPKMRTHRGAAKRVKVTGSGRLRRRRQNRSHILEKKTSVRKRRLARETDFSGGDGQRAKRMLGI